MLGLAGAFAVCCVSASLARSHLMDGLRFAGQNSIVIYTGFVFPMVAMSWIYQSVGLPFGSIGWGSLISLSVAVILPLLFFLAVRNGPLSFLYKRPDWARWPALSRLVPAQTSSH